MDDLEKCIEFDSFVPTPSQTQVLRKTLDDIIWLAPSDAVVKTTVRKSEALFHVRCLIKGSHGEFAAEGTSEYFLPALRIMESGITRELNRWKQTRKILVDEVNEKRVS